jgi:hypothetical protein
MYGTRRCDYGRHEIARRLQGQRTRSSLRVGLASEGRETWGYGWVWLTRAGIQLGLGVLRRQLIEDRYSSFKMIRARGYKHCIVLDGRALGQCLSSYVTRSGVGSQHGILLHSWLLQWQ